MSNALKDELADDPLGRGYDAMTDQELVDSLNTADRQRNRTSMTGDEVFQATDPAEFGELPTGSGNTADEQGHWLAFCGRNEIDPFAKANVELVKSIFGNTSATVINLAAARVESITRAVERGLGNITLKTLKLQSIR